MISGTTRILLPSPPPTCLATRQLGHNPLILRRDQAGFTSRTDFSRILSHTHNEIFNSKKIISSAQKRGISPPNNKSKTNKKAEVSATARYLHMSAHKVRRVIDQIRGRSYEETLMILELMPYRACYPVFKLIYSAAANGVHNMGFNEASLVIVKAEVNEATSAKRPRPKAQGRVHMIKRPTCHITVVLRDMSLDDEYAVS